MKIEKLKLTNLRNDAHFQFHTAFRHLVDKYGAQALKISDQYEAYQRLYDLEDESFKKINKSAMTAKIQDADKARDDIWIGMTAMLSAGLKHFNPEIQEAATRLKIVFDTYGNLAKKPLNEQTSAVYNILQELQGPYAADVGKVGITEWTAELQKRNKVFDALMHDRFDETAAKSSVIHKEARADADEAYRIMTERIEALMIVEGASVYEEFAKTLNAVIDKYSLMIRSKKSEKEEEIEK